MEEHYSKIFYPDDYGNYYSKDINIISDDSMISIAIGEIKMHKALPELYKKLNFEEKRELMELILNDPNLI